MENIGDILHKYKKGDKVHYQPEHNAEDEWKNGIVKEIPLFTNKWVGVVYSCCLDWDNYENYDSVLTKVKHIKSGWK